MNTTHIRAIYKGSSNISTNIGFNIVTESIRAPKMGSLFIVFFITLPLSISNLKEIRIVTLLASKEVNFPNPSS